MRNAALIVAFGAVTIGCTSPKAVNHPTPIEIHAEQGKCVLVLNGERLTLQTDADWSQIAAKVRRAQINEVMIRASTAVPYRCVGAAVFTLQRADVKIGFVAEPPPSGN